MPAYSHTAPNLPTLPAHLLPALLAVQFVPELLQALECAAALGLILLHLLNAGAAGVRQVVLTSLLQATIQPEVRHTLCNDLLECGLAAAAEAAPVQVVLQTLLQGMGGRGLTHIRQQGWLVERSLQLESVCHWQESVCSSVHNSW